MNEMYNFYEFSQLLSIRTADNAGVSNFNAPNIDSVVLQTPSSFKSSIYRYAFWSNTKGPSSNAKVNLYSYVVLCMTNGMLLFYRLSKWRNDRPVLRQLPWYNHPSKRIAALCFDPSGSWLLIATKDATLYILPARKFLDPTAEMGSSWSTNDVTEIKLPGRRAMPTQICWWLTHDGQEIAIVGNELGEICFVNLLLRNEVGGTYINVGISELELIEDDTNTFTYVLLTGTNDVQWQLVLEQEQTNYHWPLEKQDAQATELKRNPGSSTSLSLLSCLSIAEDQVSTSVAVDKDSRPKRLIQYAGHTRLKCQRLSSQTCISGKYTPTSVLSVHKCDLSIVPLFIYKLPNNSTQIILDDHLIFVLTNDCFGSCARIVCTAFASTSIDGCRDYDFSSEMQNFMLNSEETALGMCSYGSAEGCILILVTDQTIYALRPRMSPQDFFLEMILKEGDFAKADRFGRIFSLDIANLYEKAADRKLADAHVAGAVRLYQLAKCSHLRTVANFATYGFVSELLSYVKVLFTTKSTDFSTRDLKHFSNIALYCYIQQCLELRLGVSLIKQHFREFLRINQHYDEQLAVRLLASSGMYDMLIDLGNWRGLWPDILCELLPTEQEIDAKSSLTPRWIDTKMATIFMEHGYDNLLSLQYNDNFISCLLFGSLPFSMGLRPDLLRRYIALINQLILLWDEHIEPKAALLKILDPSHPALIPIWNSIQRRRRRDSEFIDSSVTFNFTTGEATLFQDDDDLLQELSKCFLSHLASMNKHYYSEHNFDPKLFTALTENEDEEFIIDPQKLLLPRSSTNIGCGFAHASAIINDSLYTWGGNMSGCLGRGPVRRDWLSAEIVLKPPAIRALSVSCGAAHTLAITDAGIYSWGSNSYGQLGIGEVCNAPKRSCYPTCIGALIDLDVVAVTCGQYHSIVLTSAGTPLTFGWGAHGQLGHGNAQNVSFPTPILAMDDKPVSRISAGYGHSLLLTTQGDVYAFGCGTFGQIGSGSSAKENKPVKVEFDEAIVLIAAGYFHNVVVSASGKISTWGCNPQTLRMRAQASRRERALRHIPAKDVQTPDDCGVTPITHELPNSSFIFTPVEVSSEDISGQIVHVVCGSNHSILLTADGGCYAWGRNYGGQLGHDSRKEQLAPASIGILNDHKIVQAGCGADFTLLVDDNGKMFGFGMDDLGQICGSLEMCHPAKADVPASPGKIYTVRTNRRVVQIKSPARSSIYKPIILNGLPQLTFKTNCAKAFCNVNVFKRRFFDSNMLYADPVLHTAIEELRGLYDSSTFEKLLEDYGNLQAAAKVALVDARYEHSFTLNLKCIKEDKSLNCDEKVEVTLKLLDYFVGLMADDTEKLKTLLRSVILFWSANSLPTDKLEAFLLSRLQQFLSPLSALMFANSEVGEEDDGQLSHFVSRISNRFCLTLVEQIIAKVNSGSPHMELLDVFAGMVSVHVPSNPALNSWTSDECRLASSSSDVHLLSALSSNSGNVKCAIDLTTEQVQNLLKESRGKEKAQVLVFTCGHHYPLSVARDSVLPRFTELLSEMTPDMSQTLTDVYATPGFQPMACPMCFIEGVRQEDSTQAAS